MTGPHALPVTTDLMRMLLFSMHCLLIQSYVHLWHIWRLQWWQQLIFSQLYQIYRIVQPNKNKEENWIKLEN